jgi:hypothetical protein
MQRTDASLYAHLVGAPTDVSQMAVSAFDHSGSDAVGATAPTRRERIARQIDPRDHSNDRISFSM